MSVLNKKRIWISFLLCFALCSYYFLADEKLKPEAAKWLSTFEQGLLAQDNLSARLLTLGKSDPEFIITINNAYEDKLARFNINALLTDLKPLQYPKVLQFEAFLDSPLFCDFTEQDCFVTLNQNKDYIELVIREFQPELTDFMSLDQVSSFESLNPFIAELDLRNLLFIYRLKGSEIYFNIVNGRPEEAAASLVSLVELNRLFFEKSDDLIHKISFSINAQKVFQPLVEQLQLVGFDSHDLFSTALKPFSLEEISVNQIHVRDYAKNARIVLAGLVARKGHNANNIFTTLWHQIVFKRNMTLNALFDDYQLIMMPKNVSKAALLEMSRKIDIALKTKAEASEQKDIAYRLKTMRNASGFALKSVILPRQVNIYDAIAELDTRLQLLSLSLKYNKKSLQAIVINKEITNYYTLQAPIIENNQLCSSINDNKVCVRVF